MPGSDLNDIGLPELADAALSDQPGPERLPGHEQSPLLTRAGFRHAFFDRRGGASAGPFESLSFSTAVGDDPEHVAENLARAGALLGVDEARILYLSQVHGRQARFYQDGQRREDLITLEGDALGGSCPDAAYGVRSADCVPILLADPKSGAVMAVHAGWRGVVAGVLEAGVTALLRGRGARGEQGAEAGRLLAAVGPHISSRAFEVSEEVAAELAAACPSVGGARADGATGGAVLRPPGRAKPLVDLRHIVTQQLLALGLTKAGIDHVGGCTYLEPERYFSFRRDGKRSGRHLSAIVPRR